MTQLKARANYRGAEGWVRRGDIFTAATEKRAAELVASGRAVYVAQSTVDTGQAAQSTIDTEAQAPESTIDTGQAAQSTVDTEEQKPRRARKRKGA